MVLCFVFIPWFIEKLQSMRIGQPIREDGPESHLSKKGTPTMGGLVIVSSAFLSTFLWARLDVVYVWRILAALVGFGAVGLMDDVRKQGAKQQGRFGKDRMGWDFHRLAFRWCLPEAGIPHRRGRPFFKTVLPNSVGYFLLSRSLVGRQRGEPHRRPGRAGNRDAAICFATYLLCLLRRKLRSAVT